MKRPLIITLLVPYLTITFGQIKNHDFEVSRDSMPTVPKDWGIKKIGGFEYTLDKEVKYSGSNSLRIKSTQDTNSRNFIPFSQFVDFVVPTFKKVMLTVYIKTDNVIGNAGLWCQIRDEKNNMIGFQNLEIQKIKIAGTNDWKKYSLLFYVDSKCKKLIPGGYLQGTGTAWFDSFAIENVEVSSLPPTKEAKEYIEDFVSIVKKHSVYSKLIDWQKLDKEIELLSKGANEIEATAVIPSHILGKLRELGDNHSHFISKATYEGLKGTGSKTNKETRQAYGKLLENNIGYVYVPGFVSLNNSVTKDFAKSIQDIIKNLDTNNISSWIVDLRENTGGNMYPMISGLGPIIGEGTLGHFHLASGKVSTRWLYKNGSTRVVKVKDPYVLKNSAVKVAVLIGPSTGSSGEMTAISFIGKTNTKFFGQPSAGLTTGNSVFKLKDGSALALATSYVSDRNKKQYLGPINPDVIVDKKADILKIASDWLNEK